MSIGSHEARRELGVAAAIIMAGTLAASLAGFVRAFVVARTFGAHAATDAFFAASVVPQIVYIQLVGGAVSAVLIPSLVRAARDDEDGMWLLVRTLLVAEAAIALVAVAALEVAARPLMLAVASGLQLHVHGDAFPLSVWLVRILLLTLPFSALSAVATAVLYSLHRRATAAFAPACYHLGIIGGALIGSARGGITALAIGAVAGAAAQCALLGPPLLAARCAGRGTRRAMPLVDFRHPALPRLLRLYLPVAAGLLVTTAGGALNVNFQSRLPQSGGLSSMQFATQLVQFPAGIVATGLGLAILPIISIAADEGRLEGLADALARGMRVCLVLMVPAAVALLLLAAPIAALVYQRGQFTALDTTYTASALLGYAPQLPLLGVAQMLIFASYARHNTLIPALAGAVGVLAYVVLALLLQRFTIAGLATAHTISVGIQALVLAAFTPLGPIARRLGPAVSQVALAAAAMVAVLEPARLLLGPEGDGLPARIAAVLIPGAPALAAYAAVLLLLNAGSARRVAKAMRAA